MMLTPLITHGFTPGRFDPDRCQVQLTRYPCPWPREAHDPRLPPVDIDCFGRRRREAGESVTPEPRTEVTTVEERDATPPPLAFDHYSPWEKEQRDKAQKAQNKDENDYSKPGVPL